MSGRTDRRPWVYMGPGVWFDQSSQRVHIRLSHTHNNVPGSPDYTGPTNPNEIGLALAEKNMRTVSIRGSSQILFKNVAIRFGGETLRLENSTDLVFDGVTISAGQYGIRSTGLKNVRLSNSVIDGGLPTWLFHSDLKAGYSFPSGAATIQNNLAAKTMEALVLGNGNDVGTEFANSEFINAHDLYLAGNGTKFHHNWIHN